MGGLTFGGGESARGDFSRWKGGGGGGGKIWGGGGGISSTPTVEQTLIPGANKRSYVLKQNCMKGLNKE